MRREWMERAMAEKEYDEQSLAMAAEVSPKLIGILLYDAANVTHPRIALRIVKLLGGGVDEYNDMVNEIHRREKLPTRIRREVISDEA